MAEINARLDSIQRLLADTLGREELRRAMDGILDLSSQRIRELDLLDEEQRQLADALQLRLDLTQRYWSTVARFVTERWPLEDMPWRTSDGEPQNGGRPVNR